MLPAQSTWHSALGTKVYKKRHLHLIFFSSPANKGNVLTSGTFGLSEMVREESEVSPDDLSVHHDEFTLGMGPLESLCCLGLDEGDCDVFVSRELPGAIGPRH